MNENSSHRLMPLGKVPADIKMQVTRVFAKSLIGLIGYQGKKYGEQDLVGSGTLVKVAHTYGILTADHVWGLLRGVEAPRHSGFHKIGLLPVTVEPNIIFPLLIPLQVVLNASITIARDPQKREGQGPDLAFIPLLPEVAQRLEVEDGCVFYDLIKGQQKWRANPRHARDGIWCINGYLGEETKWNRVEGSAENSPEYQPVTQSQGMFGGSEQGMYLEGIYDYFQVGVQVESPHSFDKVSGGGAWFTSIILNPDGTFNVSEMVDEAFLGGVIFAQNTIQNVVQSLRCHGWASIYELALPAIQRIPPWAGIIQEQLP
jgi:hypothetical protein